MCACARIIDRIWLDVVGTEGGHARAAHSLSRRIIVINVIVIGRSRGLIIIIIIIIGVVVWSAGSGGVAGVRWPLLRLLRLLLRLLLRY